jgi:hypothetical protein
VTYRGGGGGGEVMTKLSWIPSSMENTKNKSFTHHLQIEQNSWLGGYSPQIPILSAPLSSTEFVEHPPSPPQILGMSLCHWTHTHTHTHTHTLTLAKNKMYSTPDNVFKRKKCVYSCSENCSNQENTRTVNCNGLYRQTCSERELATTQGVA